MVAVQQTLFEIGKTVDFEKIAKGLTDSGISDW